MAITVDPHGEVSIFTVPGFVVFSIRITWKNLQIFYCTITCRLLAGNRFSCLPLGTNLCTMKRYSAKRGLPNGSERHPDEPCELQLVLDD